MFHFWTSVLSGSIEKYLHDQSFISRRIFIEDTVGELERLGIYVDAKELDIELPEKRFVLTRRVGSDKV